MTQHSTQAKNRELWQEKTASFALDNYMTSIQHICSFTIPMEETFSHHKPAQIVENISLQVNKQENKGLIVAPRPDI